MSLDHDDHDPLNHDRFRSRDHEIDLARANSSRGKVLVGVLGVVISLAVLYGIFAFKAGLFPFAGGSSEELDTLRQIVVEQLKIPIEKVEITGDTTAVGILPSGERLAIRWKKTGIWIECVCQKPKEEAEQIVRQLLTQLRYQPKTVTIRPAENGIGYVGTATAETGETFDVTESTDLNSYSQSMQYVKLSPSSYPILAKNLFEKSVPERVTGNGPLLAGDILPSQLEFADRSAKQESVYSARLTTAEKTYVIELVRESNAGPLVQLRGTPGVPVENAEIHLYYREVSK